MPVKVVTTVALSDAIMLVTPQLEVPFRVAFLGNSFWAGSLVGDPLAGSPRYLQPSRTYFISLFLNLILDIIYNYTYI